MKETIAFLLFVGFLAAYSALSSGDPSLWEKLIEKAHVWAEQQP